MQPTYGTASFAANNNVVLVRSGLSFDGNNSTVWEEFWVGTAAGIAAKYSEAIAIGGKARLGNDAGSSTLQVTYARDPNDPLIPEVPVDEWEDDTETAEVDLFACVQAVNEAEDYASQPATTEFTPTVAAYRKIITDAVDDGKSYPFPEAQWPIGKKIYDLLTRNVTSIPLNRPVLTRSRTFSSFYTVRNQMLAVQTVWSTDALISNFSVPVQVQARLPITPSYEQTPRGTVWGWKLTVDRSAFNANTGKVQETKTWTYAAWVAEFFNLVSA